MTSKPVFIPYRPKTILNRSRRSDHWFWTRYSAYPYKGCQHGCEFCYCREKKFNPFESTDDFAHMIYIKENAPDLLRRALSRIPIDLISLGDYQPAERKYMLTRKMLEVCHELSFPVFILTRSPLVVRDIDLLWEINQKASAVVLFSIISTPDSKDYDKVQQIERLSPSVEKRFLAMNEIAKAGILTGTCFMPILPILCDNDDNLEKVVRWTANHGGKFVLSSTLTLADQQRDYFIKFLEQKIPDLVAFYLRLYKSNSYVPQGYDWNRIAQTIRELSKKYSIGDRMPRPIINGEKLATSKQVVEYFANKAYSLEISREPGYKIWAYKKAAWAVEDTVQDIGLIYDQLGIKGLENIKGIGKTLALEVEKLVKEIKTRNVCKNDGLK